MASAQPRACLDILLGIVLAPGKEHTDQDDRQRIGAHIKRVGDNCQRFRFVTDPID